MAKALEEWNFEPVTAKDRADVMYFCMYDPLTGVVASSKGNLPAIANSNCWLPEEGRILSVEDVFGSEWKQF